LLRAPMVPLGAAGRAFRFCEMSLRTNPWAWALRPSSSFLVRGIHEAGRIQVSVARQNENGPFKFMVVLRPPRALFFLTGSRHRGTVRSPHFGY
jgi:hypothetical protein